MKKILALLLVLAMALSLAACGGSSEKQSAAAPAPAPTEPPIPSGYKEYTMDNLTMYVPKDAQDFTGSEGMGDFTFVLGNNEMAIVGLKEYFADINAGQPMTAEEYANLFMQANGFSSTVQVGNGYHYFLFDNMGNQYMAAFFADDTGVWSVQVGMEILDQSAAHLMAESVKVG